MDNIVFININCGRKNKTINVSKYTDEQIELLIDKHRGGKWIIIKE